MAPWEEDEEELSEDVGVGDVEVMLQGCDREAEAGELRVISRGSVATIFTRLTFCSMYS